MEYIIPGTEVTTAYGKTFQVTSGFYKTSLDLRTLYERFTDVLQDEGSSFRKKIDKVCRKQLTSSQDILFVDIETTGLAYTPLFLIGCLTCTDANFILSQFLARDLTEEKAVISLFLEYIEQKHLIVSFNGTRFDLPYIEKRALTKGLSFSNCIPHLDLLVECRSLWTNYLPDFKLTTIEKYICRNSRYDDIPGSEIPSMYFRFLKTKDPHIISRLIKHNAMDLLSMIEIAIKMPRLQSRSSPRNQFRSIGG